MKIKNLLYPILCIVLLAAFIILMLCAFNKLNTGVSGNNIALQKPNVIIDAGHGGEDGGAVSDSGILEKDINLSISDKVSDLINFFGFDVTRTRTDDVSLDSGESTVRARKVSDMKKRLEIFNSSDNNVVISIHQNKFTESKYYGTQIFYSPNTELSNSLAESIKYTVTSLLQPENTRECKKADSSIYLLKNAKIPAVIVECGFISNPQECEKLTNQDYQKQMAYSVTLGFLNYYNANY